MLRDNIQNFNKFCNGKPPKFIYEDEQCVVFEEELKRQAPVHFLVVPKRNISRLSQATADDEKLLGRLLNVARKIAKQKELNDSGFRVVVNNGVHGGQTIDQLNVQVFGGRQMLWPFG